MMEYLFSVQYQGRMLTLIGSDGDAKLDEVLAFARDEHWRRYGRLCVDARLAHKEARPPKWTKNPVPSSVEAGGRKVVVSLPSSEQWTRLVWMLEVRWEELVDAVVELETVYEAGGFG